MALAFPGGFGRPTRRSTSAETMICSDFAPTPVRLRPSSESKRRMKSLRETRKRQTWDSTPERLAAVRGRPAPPAPRRESSRSSVNSIRPRFVTNSSMACYIGKPRVTREEPSRAGSFKVRKRATRHPRPPPKYTDRWPCTLQDRTGAGDLRRRPCRRTCRGRAGRHEHRPRSGRPRFRHSRRIAPPLRHQPRDRRQGRRPPSRIQRVTRRVPEEFCGE
jgi:hypothetical protein